MKRPTGITITAWLWIVMGGFAYMMISKAGPLPPASGDMPADFKTISYLFQYFGVFILLQGVFALIAIWAGVSLLRLKRWARTTIEVLSWIALLYTVGFGIFWVYMWISMTNTMPQHGGPIDSGPFQWLGAAMGTIITAIFAVPLWIMIRYLRGAEVRTAIDNAFAAGRQEGDSAA